MYQSGIYLSLVFLVACASTPDNEATSAETQKVQRVKVFTSLDTLPDEKLVDIDYLLGKYNPEDRADFARIAKTDIAENARNQNQYMNSRAYQDFLSMKDAAKIDGVELKIVSAMRTFPEQVWIWERKWNELKSESGRSDPKSEKMRALKILRTRSMPGSSRHHWGTDIDLNNTSSQYFESVEGKKVYSWLRQNAHKYHYCQPYNAGRDKGYLEEKWHWTYVRVSGELTRVASRSLANSDFSGFEGAEQAEVVDIVSNYVLSINPACLGGVPR